VDAARPDSEVARHFRSLVDRYLANRTDNALRTEIRQWLTLWAGNDAKLEPLIARRQILKDAAPVSQILAKIAAEALAPSKKNRADLEAAQKPIGEVHLAVAEAIARLITPPAQHAGPSHSFP
jgi:hypothetical protein